MNQYHFVHLIDMLLSMETSLEISFDIFIAAPVPRSFCMWTVCLWLLCASTTVPVFINLLYSDLIVYLFQGVCVLPYLHTVFFPCDCITLIELCPMYIFFFLKATAFLYIIKWKKRIILFIGSIGCQTHTNVDMKFNILSTYGRDSFCPYSSVWHSVQSTD
jgi:hypothetical protein